MKAALYLTIVLELLNCEVVGLALKLRMTSDIVTDALTMAWLRRKSSEELIHHSNQGSLYAGHVFQPKLAKYGMTRSMSRKENCWDNAPTESWFGGFKNKQVYGESFKTQDEMMAMALKSTEVFCRTGNGRTHAGSEVNAVISG